MSCEVAVCVQIQQQLNLEFKDYRVIPVCLACMAQNIFVSAFLQPDSTTHEAIDNNHYLSGLLNQLLMWINSDCIYVPQTLRV